jgi:DNA-binding transcriptional LysR family regulator
LFFEKDGLKIMEIKNLEAFLILARSLNFTKSAEQMFLSQSAFSRQIIRLEEELGCQLFKRTKRNVELTVYGQNFLDHAEKIVTEYNRGMYHLSCSISEKDHLRLGMLNDLQDDMFPNIIKTFQQDHPDVAVTYSDNDMSGLINKLLRDELDIVYTLSYDTQKLSDVSSYTIWSKPVNVVMSDEHPLAGSTAIHMKDLADYPFIFIVPDTYNLGVIHINYLCLNAGFSPNIAAMVTNINSLMALVRSNVGVALVAETAKLVAPEGVKFFKIEGNEEDQLNADITILWKTGNPNPAINKFMQSAENAISRGN